MSYEEFHKKKKKAEVPEYAKEPLYVEKKPIKESFNWVAPEWKAMPHGKKSVKVKGVALTSDIVSKNQRKYLDEELKMAARTMAHCPITVNHAPYHKSQPGFNPANVIGNVIHAEYENGAIEYLGQIKKEPYVTMLKNHDANIKGVSVQAGYIHNRCVECGERFFSEKAFKVHMQESHGIVDGIEEVHGVIFDALSLVVGPETPGVPTTTIEIMETDRDGVVMKLFETVLQGKGLTLGEPTDEHGCEPDEVWDAEKEECVKKPETTEQIEKEPTPEEFGEVPGCEEGLAWNPVTKQCEPIAEVYRDLESIAKVATKKELVNITEVCVRIFDKAFEEMLEERKKAKGDTKQLEEILNVLRSLKSVYVNEKVRHIQETTKTEARLEALETKYDNMISKFRGNFKGKEKSVVQETALDEKLPYQADKKRE